MHVDGGFKLVTSKLPDPEGLLPDTLPSAIIKAVNEAACIGRAISNQTAKIQFRCGRKETMFPKCDRI